MPGPERPVAAAGRRHDVPAGRLGDHVRRDLALGQGAVREVPQRPLPRDRLVDARRRSVDLADEGRVGRGHQPAVQGRARPVEQAPRRSGHGRLSRTGRGDGSRSRGADVALGVERAAAERAAGGRPRSPAPPAARTRARGPASSRTRKTSSGSGSSSSPRRRRRSRSAGTPRSRPGDAGVPGQGHRADPELLVDRLLERLGVLEPTGRHRRDQRLGAAARPSPRRAARRPARPAPRPAASPARR